MKHAKNYPLVYIQWDDHVSDDAWLNGGEEAAKATQAQSVHSIGWLVHEDDKSYVIAQNIADDDMMTMVMRIMKGTVNAFSQVEGCKKN